MVSTTRCTFGIYRLYDIFGHLVSILYLNIDFLLTRELLTSHRGVGCIFVEMMTGSAAFPGVKDSSDQLDKIWKVLGTPSGRDRDYFQLLPQYKTDCIIPQAPQSLT